MKKTFLSLLACVTLGIGSTTAQTKGITTDVIKTYFSSYLNGSKEAYTQDTPIKNTDIAQYREAVWTAWKAANNGFSEEKLIPLDTLCASSKGVWHLPESLEPHANMPYYWGRKLAHKRLNTLSGSYDLKKIEELNKKLPAPFYLYIHGSGPKANEWATGLKICKMFNDAPSIYFIPQIPNEEGYYRWWQKSKQFAWEKLLRLALVTGLVDANRMYVFGISEGGYGSQRLASFYADYWAAAGPMAGGEPLRNAPAENCANIGFSLRTGAIDDGFYRNELTQYCMDEFAKLQKEHPDYYTHDVELIPGRGHHIDYSVTTPWLKRFTRNPYPKYFYWEDFEMDGLHRKGFYNIVVNERSNVEGQSRTCYEMNIVGNKISLNINNVTYEVTKKDPHWGIELGYAKHFTPATSGKITVYLNEQLVDLNKKVTITVNGKQMFCSKVKADVKNMVNSCATFFDPKRLYPVAVEVTL